MKIIQTLPLILILLLGSGCLILPASSPSMYSFNQQLNQLAVGSTTREEVISIIGEPDIKLKRFILYKQKIQSGEAHVFILQSSHRIQGNFMDVSFEFDEDRILTEYRFIELEPLISGLDLAECSSSCRSIYYSCLISIEEKGAPLSQCEKTLQTCFRQCEENTSSIYKEACDPGVESCS